MPTGTIAISVSPLIVMVTTTLSIEVCVGLITASTLSVACGRKDCGADTHITLHLDGVGLTVVVVIVVVIATITFRPALLPLLTKVGDHFGIQGRHVGREIG